MEPCLGSCKPPLKDDKQSLNIRQVHVFEPHGADVYFTQILLSVQFIDVAIKALNLYQEITHKKVMGKKIEEFDITQIL